MPKIKYRYEELSADEFVCYEICKNVGSNTEIKGGVRKEDLQQLCDKKNIPYSKYATKDEVFGTLLDNGFTCEQLAKMLGVGVFGKLYRDTFNLDANDIRRLENHGVLKVVGWRRVRVFDHWRDAKIYDPYQFERMTDEDMKELLKKYPPRKRSCKKS